MEAVGAVASVVTLIELAAKIGSACVQYLRAAKDAANDISRLQKEVKSLQDLLEQVKQLVDNPKATRLAACQAMKDGIEVCKSELQGLNQKLSPSKTRRLMSRVNGQVLKWPFKSAEVDRLLDHLERCKQSMTLALQVDQRYAVCRCRQLLRILTTRYTAILP